MAVFEDTLTDAVTALPLMNAKAPSDPFPLSIDSSFTRVASSTSAASVSISTYIPSGRDWKYIPMLFISSAYGIAVPAGWITRVNIAAEGQNGSLYFRVLELPKDQFYRYPYNTSITLSQGVAAPICVVSCLFTVSGSGYAEFIEASTSATNNAATDLATPPSLTATNEREGYIVCMTASPHPTSGTMGYPSGSYPAAPTGAYAPTTSNNVAVAYYLPSIRKGAANSGNLGLNSSAVNTTNVALLSATLRYALKGPLANESLLTIYSTPTAVTRYNVTRTEAPAIVDSLRWNWGQVLAESATIGDPTTRLFSKSATATAVAQFLDAQALKYTYRPVMIETPQIVDSQLVTWPRAVSESLGVAPSVVAARALRVIEALRLTEAVAPVLFYKLTVSEALLARDLLARFVAGDVIEGLGVSASLAGIRRFAPAVAEALGLSETVSRKVVLRLVSTESMNLTSAQALKLLFKPTIDEAVELTLAYIAPNESITTWAVNTRTGAASEYTGFNFNSFAEMGRSYLAASSSGLYELKGNTDDTADIIAKIKTGLASLGDGRHVMFRAVYLGMRGSDEFYFKVDAGDGREYVYKIAVQDMETTKVRLGKGLRARYFAFELESLGQDFDLESVEFVPVLSTRHR